MGKLKDYTEAEKEVLGELMSLSSMVARKKIELFEEQLKDNPNPSRLQYLTISAKFWENEYNKVMGYDKKERSEGGGSSQLPIDGSTSKGDSGKG